MTPLRLPVATLTLLALSPLGTAPGLAAWKTHRHDAARSGMTGESLELPLVPLWTFRSRYPPAPAWRGPARRDGWHKVDNLSPRMVFDWAYHTVLDANAVYFGSSSDDKIYCLDARSGAERWSFFTEAPVRLAPTLEGDRLFAGSDDGWVYCLSAASGRLLWKHHAAPERRRVAGNGRIMSLWPVRSGVAVEDGVAYFAAGLFGFEGAYLCALDARDGSVLWKQRTDQCPQGYLVASPARLYLPTGRGTPAVFRRQDGAFLHSLPGPGGAFCVLSGDLLLYGPGRRAELSAFHAGAREQLATFAGNQIVATPARSYLHTDTDLRALDRVRYVRLLEERQRLHRERETLEEELEKLGARAAGPEGQARKKRLGELEGALARIAGELPACVLWQRPCRYPYSLILAGETLFAGGTGEVAAVSAETGETWWTAAVSGRALDIAAASGRLVVSTDRGAIHCFGTPPRAPPSAGAAPEPRGGESP